MSKFTYRYINVKEKNWDLSGNYHLILWDLDGTLYSIPKLVKKIKRRLIFKPLNLFEITNFKKTEHKISKERRDDSYHLENYHEDFQRMQDFINDHLHESLILEKSRDAFEKFNHEGIEQIVVSEYPISDKLEILGLKKYFSAAYSSPVDFQCWKPNKKMAKNLIQMHDFSRGLILFGDRDDTDGVLFQNLLKELSESH
tara:strand:+ start:8034 stop:8630 length:597 start_codon:yes stop_codon:yes gene_type:complete